MPLSIIPNIITQHAEEAAFLWLLRDSAVNEPHYSLSDLAHLDDRVEANIDGLRIASDEGWEICKEALVWEESGEYFIAAFLAFESDKDDRIQSVIEAGSDSPELSRGIISALGWLPYQQAEGHIKKLLYEQSSVLRYIGIATSAIHRQYPGQPLFDALSSSDLLLKSRALKAVGELKRRDLLSVVNLNRFFLILCG